MSRSFPDPCKASKSRLAHSVDHASEASSLAPVRPDVGTFPGRIVQRGEGRSQRYVQPLAGVNVGRAVGKEPDNAKLLGRSSVSITLPKLYRIADLKHDAHLATGLNHTRWR